MKTFRYRRYLRYLLSVALSYSCVSAGRLMEVWGDTCRGGTGPPPPPPLHPTASSGTTGRSGGGLHLTSPTLYNRKMRPRETRVDRVATRPQNQRGSWSTTCQLSLYGDESSLFTNTVAAKRRLDRCRVSSLLTCEALHQAPSFPRLIVC